VTQVVGSVADVEKVHIPNPNKVAYLTQTTLSLDETRDIIQALKIKFPNIKGPAAQDICYATENRQTAVKQTSSDAGLLLVVGSVNSSNSNRLVEVARNLGTPSHLIENYRSIQPEWLEGVKTVTLTAGASAPEILVQEAVTYLMEIGFNNVQEVEVMPENVRFGLPPEIADAVSNAPREFVRIEGASVS
jgi:4-hydroxy-3-methylbut-2-en-1-yl diphosphate reductase